MGILDEKRYADNMTRTEVADALKNGHPLIAGYLVADAAKQMQENDALLKVLEQQSGISQPGQSITDKLETYLRNPNAAQQQKPGGPPGGPPKGPPKGPPGGPPRRPGPMPQGGPPGAGGPMPGPRVAGGAGGAMPGAQLGPQGPGAPMRRGGVVGFQQGGGVADELTYGQEDDPGLFRRAIDYTKEHPFKAAGKAALYGSLALPGIGWAGGAAARAAPWALRGAMGAGRGLWGLRAAAGGPGMGAGITQGLGRGALGLSQKGGLRGFLGRRLLGKRSTGFDPLRATGERTWRNRMMGQGGRGPTVTGSGFIGAGELGRTALLRGSIGGLAGVGLLDYMSPEALEALSDEERADLESWIAKQGGAGGGAGKGRSAYQDIYDQIQDYADSASVPSASELARYKLAEDRAKGLKGRRSGIEALMPTEQQYADTARSVGFGGLSKVLARTGDPSKRQDFGQVGEDIRGETTRQLGERLGFEDKLAGIDTDIYGVESGSLGERALRERAGDAFQIPMIGAMQSELQAKQALDIAMLNAQAQGQAQGDYYRPQNIPGILNLINDPSSIEYMSPEQKQAVIQQILSRLNATGPSPDDGMSNEDLMRLLGRLGVTEGS